MDQRCDGCPATSTTRWVRRSGGELVLCKEHTTKNERKLRADGWRIAWRRVAVRSG